MQIFDIVAAIMFLIIAAIEVFIVVTAILASSFSSTFAIFAYDANSKASLWHDYLLWQSPSDFSLM